MRRWILVLLTLLLIAPQVSGGGPGHSHITIMHFNDDYQLGPVDQGKAGGLDRLATAVNKVRQSDPEALLLFAGDLISPSVESTLFRGAQLIDGFNQLGVDIATLGNHEFDYGPQELQKRLAESQFPWVITNVVQSNYTKLPMTELLLRRTVRGVEVGFFGLLTQETPTSSSPGPNIRFLDEVGAAKAAVTLLRKRGAAVVIALTHLRMEKDQEVVRGTPGITLVIGGHDHEPLRAVVNGVLIRKAGSDARFLGIVRLTVMPDGSVVSVQDELVPITDQTPSDPKLAAVLKFYTAQLSKALDLVVGRTQVELDARTSTVRAKESSLGNFIADAMRQAVDADVAITNSGGIRSNAVFPAGPLARKDVLGWLPFGNVITKVRVRGATIRAALENGVSQVPELGGRFPQVSGLRFSFNPTRPAGHRIVEVSIGGRPLDPSATYTVAINDFILGGGDGYAMFRAEGEVLIDAMGGPVMATAVMQAIQRAQTIAPAIEGRIQIVQ